MSGSKNKTLPNQNISVQDFLATVTTDKQHDSQVLIEMMRAITGHEPVMWGTSIIGFDSYHYKYATGREGEMAAMSFSPRKANLTIYIAPGFEQYGEYLEKLGKHSSSVSCLYIKKLADIDLDILQELVSVAYAQMKSGR